MAIPFPYLRFLFLPEGARQRQFTFIAWQKASEGEEGEDETCGKNSPREAYCKVCTGKCVLVSEIQPDCEGQGEETD